MVEKEMSKNLKKNLLKLENSLNLCHIEKVYDSSENEDEGNKIQLN